MIRLNSQRFFCFCLLINLYEAFATSQFISFTESQRIAAAKASELYYDEIELFENSLRSFESICEEKDRSKEYSSQDSSQDTFLSFSFDDPSNNSKGSSLKEKSKENFGSIFKISTQSCEFNQSDKDYHKGKEYYEKRSLEAAFNCFYQAAKKDHIESYYVLGHMYNYGQGVQKNTQKSLKFYLKATNLGHEKAAQITNSLLAKDPLSIKSNPMSLKRSQGEIKGPPLKKRRFLEKSQDSPSKVAQMTNSLLKKDPLLIKSDPMSLKRSQGEIKGPPLKKRRFLEKSQDVLNNDDLNHLPLIQSAPSQGILTPPLIRSLGQIIDDYDVFLVDIVGVIHNGKEAFEHSIQLINNLVKTKKVALVSNTPRPYTNSAETLNKMGLDSQIPIFTAGDMVRDDLINEYKGQKIYHLGAERNQDILRNLDVQITPTLEHANIVLLTQYIEENEPLEQFDSILEDIAARKLVVLCANSDKISTVGDKLRYCAGTLAEKIEDFEGVVRYYGKPDTKLFDLVLSKIPDIENIPNNRVLVIGDTLEKDIKGACNSDLHSLLVLTGTTAQDIQRTGQDVKTVLKKLCVHQKTKPTYYINSIK